MGVKRKKKKTSRKRVKTGGGKSRSLIIFYVSGPAAARSNFGKRVFCVDIRFRAQTQDRMASRPMGWLRVVGSLKL